MDTGRKIRKVIRGKPVIEGAGVHLRRVFGFGETKDFDPFLLLDDFRSDDPQKFLSDSVASAQGHRDNYLHA